MTLKYNVMALILRYFTEFGSCRAHCVKVVDKAMDNLRLLCLVSYLADALDGSLYRQT